MKSFLTTRSMLGKSLSVVASILFLATSCSSGNEQASSKPTVTPPTEIVTRSPTPDPTPTPAATLITEPSPTPDSTRTASKQPKTKESKSVVTPSAAPKKSKAPSKPSPSTKKLTNAELALKYPPTIGTLVPWYFPTPEQAGKAYTNLKPYETGSTYALYQEEGSILWIYASRGDTNRYGDTVVWSAFRFLGVNASEIVIAENEKSSLGENRIILFACDGDRCVSKMAMESTPIGRIPVGMTGIWQSWGSVITLD